MIKKLKAKNLKLKIKPKIKKGDLVLVTTGKDRNKTGKVEKVFPNRARVIVTGVNIMKKSSRPTKKNPHGGIMQFPMPIQISNIQLICPRCNKTTRVGYKLLRQSGKFVSRPKSIGTRNKMLDTTRDKARQGKKIRICKKCGESVEQ